MPAVSELPVASQGAQERLLKRVLCPLAAESPGEEGEDLLAMFLVEQLEGGNVHKLHHPV